MLTQHCLTLTADGPCHPRPEWGYRLYAALLESAPPSFGDRVHQDAVTPISQYLVSKGTMLYWYVTLLGQKCQEIFTPVLDRTEAVTLQKDNICLKVLERSARTVPDVETLLTWATGCSGRHRLKFWTSTAFKSKGQYLNLPTARLMVQSLLKKWNGCFPDCPIEDADGEGMETLATGLRFQRFQISDRIFYLKGNPIPGFIGTLHLENQLSGFHRQLTDALLLFSGYAGVGIKTTLGMGGVEHQIVN